MSAYKTVCNKQYAYDKAVGGVHVEMIPDLGPAQSCQDLHTLGSIKLLGISMSSLVSISDLSGKDKTLACSSSG